MEDINLGKKVQDFRNKSGMSLRELAKRAGLTASMLSQIERDLVNPSIGTLKAIAQALDVPMFKFFKDDEPQVQMIVRRGENKTIGHPDADLAYTLLTPDVRGSIEFCMMSIPPGRLRAGIPRSMWGRKWPTLSGEVWALMLQAYPTSWKKGTVSVSRPRQHTSG